MQNTCMTMLENKLIRCELTKGSELYKLKKIYGLSSKLDIQLMSFIVSSL